MIRFPSGLTSTAEGYHPVGINPATRLAPRLDTSITQSALLSALATYSVSPSGESARAFGVLPAGALGVREHLMVSTCRREVASRTVTSSELPQLTNSRPSLESARSFGWSPIVIRSATFGSAGFE